MVSMPKVVSAVACWAWCAVLMAIVNAAPAAAQASSRVPPMAVYQAMLNANKATGWVQFRDYNGRQLLYFTALQTMHCRLAEIRYSINSTLLDKTFALVPCNPALPMSLPPNAGLEDIAVSLPLGSAEMVAVQVKWQDGSASETVLYRPCPNVGDQTCALPMQ